MKSKFIIIVISILSVANLSAKTSKTDSTTTKKIKYRTEIGYSQQFRYGNNTTTSRFDVLSAGMNVEFPFKWGLGLETGLRYSYGFGNREQKYPHTGVAKINHDAHWLSLPLKATYHFPIFWDMKLFFYAGPTINVGILHNEKIDFTQKKTDPAPDIKLPYPVSGEYDMYENNLRRFSIQLGGGGGVQWRNFRLKSGYDWGLNNVSKIKNRPERIKGWHISLEYEF